MGFIYLFIYLLETPNSGSPNLLPSLLPGLGSYTFPRYCYGFFSLSRRGIIDSVGVSQLY